MKTKPPAPKPKPVKKEEVKKVMKDMKKVKK